jgi:hypothetical protein
MRYSMSHTRAKKTHSKPRYAARAQIEAHAGKMNMKKSGESFGKKSKAM